MILNSTSPGQVSESLLGAALAYARRGWPVLPIWELDADGNCACPLTSSTRDANGLCRHPGKHPVGELVPRGVHDATTDQCLIVGWWDRRPRANVAVATGTGRVVLDIDPRNGGSDCLEALKQKLGGLPETVTCSTGGGGTHLHFAMPQHDLRSSLGPGVDVKGTGGYVVAPPSSHASGGSYVWCSEGSPDEVALAALPTAWQDALARPVTNDASADQRPSCDIPIDVRERRARSYVARMPIAVAGEAGHRSLWAVAVVVVRGMLLPDDRAMSVLRDYSSRCRPPWSERELRHKLVQATRARVPWGYLVHQQEADADAGWSQRSETSADFEPPRVAGERAVLRRMSDIQPEELEWIWNERVPRGKLTLLAGEPGVGKSTLAQAIAAAVSVGVALPDDEARPPAEVVMLSAEESPGDTIRPRLERMGADLSRIHVLDGISDKHGIRQLSLASASDRQQLENVVTTRRAALVVIDVLQAYLGTGVDMHRANEVRAILAPLTDLAARTGAAILLLGHTNKSASTSVNARVMGSVDIVAAVRCVLIAGRDADTSAEGDRGIVARGKSNLPGRPLAVGYELRDGTLLWNGPRPGVTAEQLLDVSPARIDSARPATTEAMDFLRRELEGGEQRGREVQAKAQAVGISATTLERARRALGVTSHKCGFGENAFWVWTLQAEVSEARQRGEDGHALGVTAFEQRDDLRDAEAVDV